MPKKESDARRHETEVFCQRFWPCSLVCRLHNSIAETRAKPSNSEQLQERLMAPAPLTSARLVCFSLFGSTDNALKQVHCRATGDYMTNGDMPKAVFKDLLSSNPEGSPYRPNEPQPPRWGIHPFSKWL